MWFEALTGFREETPDQVREHLDVHGDTLTSLVNGQTYRCGTLETPTLEELRTRTQSAGLSPGKLVVKEQVGDVQKFHNDADNAGAMFQVASQFNLLEMVGPAVTPEQGVAIYQNDFTQGPACAIACGAGTIYRNYFANINGEIGQTADRQVDCLKDVGVELGNVNNVLWEMQNGYALASLRGLQFINSKLHQLNTTETDVLRSRLRIGIQHNTEVTLNRMTALEVPGHSVSQAFCSALPVACSEHASDHWEAFSRLVLEAAYEATFCAAVLNSARTGNNRLFLTLLGGGAFGNRTEWIVDSIERAINLHQYAGLNVIIISYAGKVPAVQRLLS